jgi:hypothetical protein
MVVRTKRGRAATEPARTQETRARPGRSDRCSLTVGTSAGCRKLGSACDVARRGASWRLAGWGGMGVSYEYYVRLFVLWSRRDGLPFGDAEQQARATGSGEG